MYFDLKHNMVSLLRRVALAITLAAGSSIASAAVIHVDIDTSAFTASSGYLDLQLSATSGLPLATVVVSNLTGFGAIDMDVGVTTAAGGFQFRNDVANYLSHAVSFGGVLSFDLSFAGAFDPLTTYQSIFSVSAFDLDFAAMGGFDPETGALAVFTWTPSLTANAGGSLGIDVSDPNVTVIPEPSDLLLTGVGLAAMALVLRRRTIRTAPQERNGAGMAVGLAA